ncbi:hypothetical protein NQ317_006520 [Molorchus minor]|uniref:Uncharacterized protein n=1 Tax=Molorchus minor TaxID=1323400 RepID=A0ABQ9IVV7_9CUCU|nr:hypothetical protein NQ317_006520 [Molorchus minor]
MEKILQAMQCNLHDQKSRNSSGLINTKTLSKTKDDSFQKNLDIHHPRNDIWRSETVLTVFTDMWLYNDQVNQPANNLNNSFNACSPPGYMRIVRVLVKQLHAFSSSARADDTHLAELKKNCHTNDPGKFYIFLRKLLVLELWLTYIQPWRYPVNNLVKHLNKQETNPDVEDVAVMTQHSVDREYLPFITENLLAYTVIFQQLLPRFGRVDLVSPKMSLMLYRITKVFDQPNLPNYLREVEHCVENNRSPSHKYSDQWASSFASTLPHIEIATRTSFSPVVNNTFLNTSVVHLEKKWSAIVRQKIFELEGPNFCYKPLFSDPPAPEVF